jgi:NADP-dependent 3-hydroxy acid dehydrogenase YdfG
MAERKSIIVTGAASGIGYETARLFSERGWFVGIFDVSAGGLKSLQGEIGDENCFSGVMDVTDANEVKAGIASFAEKTGGKIHALFNNAGVLRMGMNDTVSIEDQHLIVDTNFKGVLNCIDAALPYLKDTPDAHIINMASTSAVYGIPELAVYSATKHAVCAMTEALDIELENYGITVSDIITPYVNTPMIKDAPVKAFSIDKLGVNVEPIEIAETVWKAAHGQKLHWKIQILTHILYFAFWLLPFAKRFIVKVLTIPPKK